MTPEEIIMICTCDLRRAGSRRRLSSERVRAADAQGDRLDADQRALGAAAHGPIAPSPSGPVRRPGAGARRRNAGQGRFQPQTTLPSILLMADSATSTARFGRSALAASAWRRRALLEALQTHHGLTLKAAFEHEFASERGRGTRQFELRAGRVPPPRPLCGNLLLGALKEAGIEAARYLHAGIWPDAVRDHHWAGGRRSRRPSHAVAVRGARPAARRRGLGGRTSLRRWCAPAAVGNSVRLRIWACQTPAGAPVNHDAVPRPRACQPRRAHLHRRHPGEAAGNHRADRRRVDLLPAPDADPLERGLQQLSSFARPRGRRAHLPGVRARQDLDVAPAVLSSSSAPPMRRQAPVSGARAPWSRPASTVSTPGCQCPVVAEGAPQDMSEDSTAKAEP